MYLRNQKYVRVRSECYSSSFFNDTATTEIYTLSLHDALPISLRDLRRLRAGDPRFLRHVRDCGDRQSTRLNSSHLVISDAVFCLNKHRNTQRCERIESDRAPLERTRDAVGPC